jgi:hypothetical protein
MDIRQQIKENNKQVVASLRAMPVCECGHPRIKHGVHCDSSCVDRMCDCYGYKPLQSQPEGEAVTSTSE